MSTDRSRTPHWAWLAIACFEVAALLVLLVYLAFTVPGPWFSSAKTLSWSAQQMTVTRGAGARSANELIVQATDSTGTAIVSINTSPFYASDYKVVAWNIAGATTDLQLSFVWRSEFKPGKINSIPLQLVSGGVAPLELERQPEWLGRIVGIGLVARGELSQLLAVQSVSVKPMSAIDILTERWQEWNEFVAWNPLSINAVIGGAFVQQMPLPILVAVILIVATLLYWALLRLKRWRFSVWILAAFALTAWLLVDLRWQATLWRQVAQTYERFGGKTIREKHLADDDGVLFAFIEQVRPKLPSSPARVFIFGEDSPTMLRGAYHLLPHRVHYANAGALPTASALKAGDYVAVYRRRGVQYDSAKQLLRWDDQNPIAAELVFVHAGAALFKVR